MHNENGFSISLVYRFATMMLLSIVLSACGGGGPVGTGGGTQAPRPPTITVSAVTTTVPANPLLRLPELSAPTTIQINAQVRDGVGNNVPDGTLVNITTTNAAVGTVSAPDDPNTTNVNEFAGFFPPSRHQHPAVRHSSSSPPA